MDTNQKVRVLALQKKTYASPQENMDAVTAMLEQYAGAAAGDLHMSL